MYLEGPGLVKDANSDPNSLEEQSLAFAGKKLTFYREDLSYTTATILSIYSFDDQYGNYITGVRISIDELDSTKVGLPYYNCFSFGNGVESNRIRDDFNESFILNGVKASTVLEQPYEEERRKYGLIYSGIYNNTSGVNNLNQFIQAEKITKDVMPSYGSIQKLYARDKDLITLCEDKVLRIMVDKDILYNADGNAQLLATNMVLGTAEPFRGNFGISKNPESFAAESFRAYFTDKQRGAVIRLSMDGLTPISDSGMHDFFRDNLKFGGKLYGSYDLHKKDYNLTIFYADGQNLLQNSDLNEGDMQFDAGNPEQLSNPNFTSIQYGTNNGVPDSEMFLPNGFGYGSGWIKLSTGSPDSIHISANNAPATLVGRQLNNFTSSTKSASPSWNGSNQNSADGSGSILFKADDNNGEYLGLNTGVYRDISNNLDFPLNSLSVGDYVTIRFDLFDINYGNIVNNDNADLRVWFVDDTGRGIKINKNYIRFGNEFGGGWINIESCVGMGVDSCRIQLNAFTILDAVTLNAPARVISSGPSKWRITIETVGDSVDWNTAFNDDVQFKLDNVVVKLDNVVVMNDWEGLATYDSTNNALNSGLIYQELALTEGWYRFAATISDVITPGLHEVYGGYLNSDDQITSYSFSFDLSGGAQDVLDDITATGYYYKDFYINADTTANHNVFFGNPFLNASEGVFKITEYSVKELIPLGGTIEHWNLVGEPENLFYQENVSGQGSIRFELAEAGTLAQQNLTNVDGFNTQTEGALSNEYRITFTITDASDIENLSLAIYNNEGQGMQFTGFNPGQNVVEGFVGQSETTDTTVWGKFTFFTTDEFSGNVDNIFLEMIGGGDTVTFSEDVGGWTSFKSFVPEFGISVVNQYYTMNKGKLYKHHISDDLIDRNTFYGEYSESIIKPVLNMQPALVKNYNTLNYEGSQSRVLEFSDYETPTTSDNPNAIQKTLDNELILDYTFEDGTDFVVNWDISTGTANANTGDQGAMLYGDNTTVIPLIGSTVDEGDAFLYTGSYKADEVPTKIFYNLDNLEVGQEYKLVIEATYLAPNNPPYLKPVAAINSSSNIISDWLTLNTGENSLTFIADQSSVTIMFTHPMAAEFGFDGSSVQEVIEDLPSGILIHSVSVKETYYIEEFCDGEYYNLYPRDGWYVENIYTNKQRGSVREFIEKEGKWFNYIKGDNVLDTAALNFQGLGILNSVENNPDLEE